MGKAKEQPQICHFLNKSWARRVKTCEGNEWQTYSHGTYELQNCNIIKDKIWNIENELAGKTGQRSIWNLEKENKSYSSK